MTETGTAIVLRVLRLARKWEQLDGQERWTPTSELLRAAGDEGMTVHSRVADARRVLAPEGLTIESKIIGKRASGKPIHAYRIRTIFPADIERAPDPPPPPPPVVLDGQLGLLDGLTDDAAGHAVPQAWRDSPLSDYRKGVTSWPKL